ncbi:MAG: nitroreductase family protein, partial [Firmicutes bacterium]|nr:nitroreductase family protein [Bacillota bacterium]
MGRGPCGVENVPGLIETIRRRRSVRELKSEGIPEEIIREIVDAGRHAPSAGNLQPWHFFVVVDPDKRRGLAVAALNELWIADAPAIVAVCAEIQRVEERYGERGRDLYVLQDTAAAVQNMLLAAEGLGVGACWVG